MNFTRGWNHHAQQLVNARNAYMNHKGYDAKNDKLFAKWSEVIDNARDYINIAASKGATNTKLRNEFLDNEIHKYNDQNHRMKKAKAPQTPPLVRLMVAAHKLSRM